MANQRFSILGTEIQALSLTDITNIIAQAVTRRERRIIVYHNLHSVYLYHHDDSVATLYDKADHVYVDGMPLIFIGRLLGFPLNASHRTTLLDSFQSLMAEAARKDWRVLYLGSKPDVAAQGAQILLQRLPELKIFTLHGYFDSHFGSPENDAVIQAIDGFQPDILLVGMGMPRQERWLLENLDRLHPSAIVTCGATMDYLTGEIAAPPRWAGPLGLYWSFRLLNEPLRLWRRYLLEPWSLLRLFVAQVLLKNSPSTH